MWYVGHTAAGLKAFSSAETPNPETCPYNAVIGLRFGQNVTAT